MITYPDTLARVTKRLCEVTCDDPAAVTPNTALAELCLDSLDMAELAFGLEHEFGVRLGPDDLSGVENVHQLTHTVMTKLLPTPEEKDRA